MDEALEVSAHEGPRPLECLLDLTQDALTDLLMRQTQVVVGRNYTTDSRLIRPLDSNAIALSADFTRLGAQIQRAAASTTGMLQQAVVAGEPARRIRTSTVAVQTGMAFHASIAASKGAVEGLVRTLAAEWAPRMAKVRFMKLAVVAP